MRYIYKILVRKCEEKRQRGKPRRIWEDNVTMNLWEIGYGKIWTGCNWFRIRTSGRLL
jgi:hypothetical protein